jgi:exodeoxyribonuclease V gamma subunit
MVKDGFKALPICPSLNPSLTMPEFMQPKGSSPVYYDFIMSEKGKFFVFFSNNVEQLLESFKQTIFSSSTAPFTRRLVVVSTPALKSWLMLQMARDPQMRIAAGLEIGYLDETIEKLRFLFSGTQAKKIPSLVELGLAIEIEIRRVLKQFLQLSHEEKRVWQPLIDYIQLTPGKTISKKSERRLISLAVQLARLFRHYGKYGRDMLIEWETGDLLHWQQGLWKQVFFNNYRWSYLYHELKEPLCVNDSLRLEVHLFSISYIPPLFHRYLEKVSEGVPLHYYLLSPCQYFWSDIRSDRETSHLFTYWKSQGVNQQQLYALEEFLRDRNPLLANFGRLGRQMAELIENSSIESFERYILPDSIKEHPQLESITDHTAQLAPASFPLTLLQAVQSDLLLLRNPVKENKLSFSEFDRSIQIHSSSSKLREIQALYNLLVDILLKHASDEEPIYPQDILVMAPDIAQYEPFIKMVFQGRESKLDSHIMDLSQPSQEPLVKDFLQLLSLPFGRWDIASLFQLFESSSFMAKHQLTVPDIEQIRLWTKDAGVSWGIDSEQRRELLQRDHCRQNLSEQASSGTWDFGIERLLTGLILWETNEETSFNFSVSPLQIDSAKSELVGKLISLLKSLRADLKPLHDGSLFTLKQWSSYLQCLYEAYFQEVREASSGNGSLIQESLTTLRLTSRAFVEEKFTFSSIQKHLEIIVNQQEVNYKESRLHAATFCSLMPMRTIPAKVIVLVGMQEGSYPRYDQAASLNLLVGHPGADDYPCQTEFDRYLFLEALLSARRYFIMSYTAYSEEDFKEIYPSLLVTELLNYLDKAYDVHHQPPSSFCKVQHPFHSFDKSYFEENGLFRSYQQSQYQAAKAFYRTHKSSPYHFIPHFQVSDLQPSPPELCLNLRDLNQFARNPLKAYFNKKLGMYLPQEASKRGGKEEALLWSYLDYDGLKKASLKKPIEDILHLTKKRGLLPLGLFFDVSLATLQEKIEELKENLSLCGVETQNLFTIEFNEHYKTPEQTPEGNWRLPPLTILYKDAFPIKIIGKLNDVSSQGVVAHVGESKEIGKVWPQFLVFHCLIQEHALNMPPCLILTKSGKIKGHFTDHPNQLLEQYLEYYFAGMNDPSPLLPEWIPIILAEEGQKLMEKLESSVNDPNQSLYNEYLEWILTHSYLPDSILNWKSYAHTVFGDMMNHWFPATYRRKE